MNDIKDILRRISIEAAEIARDVATCLRRYAVSTFGSFRSARGDLFLAFLAGSAAFALAVWRFRSLDFTVLTHTYDLWFGADSNRVIGADTDRLSNMHYRTTVHPLYSLLGSLPIVVLGWFGLGAVDAVSVAVGTSAFAFAAAFFVAARALGLRRPDAVVACALMLSSSAALFWLPVPETFALGGVSMLVPLIWLLSKRSANDTINAPLQSILSLSVTVTNWMAGIVAATLALGLRRAIQISFIALTVVLSLGVVQRMIFPHAGMPFDFREEKNFVNSAPVTLLHQLYTLITEPVLAPAPTARFEWGKLVVGFGSVNWSASFCVALAGWSTLTVLAVLSVYRRALQPQVLLFFGLLLTGQFALYTFYGDAGFFLYSLHFVPLLVLLLASAFLGTQRKAALAIAVVTAIASGAHNLRQLDRATDLLNTSVRLSVEQDMGSK